MTQKPFIDSWRARAVAGMVMICCCLSLAYLHRADIAVLLGAPDPAQAAAASGPLAECLAERFGAVDKMLSEGLIGEEQHRLFRNRAAAMCQDRFGG